MFSPKRIIALLAISLILFLSLYTWDARTGTLSRLAGMGGLEIVSLVLSPGVWIKDKLSSFWDDYIALTGVASENAILRERLGRMEQEFIRLQEEQFELARLRDILEIPVTPPWSQTGARVVAAKFGPQATLDSIMINKGFFGGALPGAPVASRNGLVGRVLRSAPNSATVQLITDPAFRVAVIGQNSRTRGILSGGGARQPLELLYVAPNSRMQEGELLICSGIDGVSPRGVPAARIISVRDDNDLLFPKITAESVVDMNTLEYVMVLIPPKAGKADELFYSSQQDAADDHSISDEEAARGMGVD